VSALAATYWTWRRELHAMLRAPIIYVVGGVFLVVQGIAFAGLVNALADPRRPALLGTLLEGQLAGTLLTWVLELVVLALLGMRAIAEDKRSGAWELLLTAQVGEGAAVIGKWLAATTIYIVVWLPTLAYFVVLSAYRADAGGWDLAAIATGYLGAFAIGAALLAWAIAASAAASSLLGAGALGFGLLVGIFLIGELPDLWPELALDHPTLAAALEAVSIRSAARGFAHGELALPAVVLIAGLAVVGLSLAIALACAGRRRPSQVRLRLAGTVAIAVGCVLAGVVAARHPMRLDVSADNRNTLDPGTLDVLAVLPSPAILTIVQPTLGGLGPIYDEIERVAGRMAEAGQVRVRVVDPARAPGGLATVARAAGLVPDDLAAGGAVVVELGHRRRVVDLLAIATIQRSPDREPTIERLAIEQALTGALAALALDRLVTACATTSHGELSLTATDGGYDWALIADRLAAEGITVEEVSLVPAVPSRCDVLIVAGPAVPLSASEALAVQSFTRGGGGLVVAAASRTLDSGPGATGLEAVLAAEGLGIATAITFDPELSVRELPNALLVIDGYADHPINAGFARIRPTLWFQARPVLTTGAARPLVSATRASWGERDFTAEPAKHDDDIAGPIALAAIGAHRVIAIGSAESFSTDVLRRGASAGDLWLARVVRHAAGAPEPRVQVADRAPAQVRLVLTSAQRNAVIAMSVAGIPLAWVIAGGAIVLWRRRRIERRNERRNERRRQP
jgi:ABC-2 type transport system permease protein